MSLPSLRVQLATFRHGPEFYYRAQVVSGDIPIATTVQAWPHNAGCGAAAAISDAHRSLEAIAYQTWIDASRSPVARDPNSLKSEQFTPLLRTKGKHHMKMKFSDYVTIVVACVLALGIGGIIALPLILKMEIGFALIDFFGRH